MSDDPIFTDVDTFRKEITDITKVTAFINSLEPSYFTKFMDVRDKRLKNMGSPQQPSGQSSMPEPEKVAAVLPLSTKPYFCVTLEGQHLAQNSPGLGIPGKLHENLPSDTVPAKILYEGKVWHLDYFGKEAVKRFENEGWGKFVKDNDLKLGDAFMFELTDGSSESSSIEFEVQFLKDGFPDELLEKAPGYLADNP